MVAGLFAVHKKGHLYVAPKIIREIKQSLQINRWYKNKLIFLAGDVAAARVLESFDLPVFRVFDDAPAHVCQEPAFRMKHWMIFWMLQKFGEVLWIDWDTINLIPLDDAFFSFCRAHQTPKFVYIPGYHATVNCSVYYVSHHWIKEMERSFSSQVSNPNDELLWTSVLPKDVVHLKEFWWGDKVVNVWLKSECSWIKKETYFVHVKTFSYLKQLNLSQ